MRPLANLDLVEDFAESESRIQLYRLLKLIFGPIMKLEYLDVIYSGNFKSSRFVEECDSVGISYSVMASTITLCHEVIKNPNSNILREAGLIGFIASECFQLVQENPESNNQDISFYDFASNSKLCQWPSEL